MYVFMYAYIHRSFVCICMYACMHTQRDIYMYIYIYIDIHADTDTDSDIDIDIDIDIDTDRYIDR